MTVDVAPRHSMSHSLLNYLAEWTRARFLSAMWTMKRCPWCRGKLETGFGLAGGGYGTYRYCLTTGCRFFVKRQSRDGD